MLLLLQVICSTKVMLKSFLNILSLLMPLGQRNFLNTVGTSVHIVSALIGLCFRVLGSLWLKNPFFMPLSSRPHAGSSSPLPDLSGLLSSCSQPSQLSLTILGFTSFAFASKIYTKKAEQLRFWMPWPFSHCIKLGGIWNAIQSYLLISRCVVKCMQEILSLKS